MKHIHKATLTYDDGTTEEFEGNGVANIVNSVAPSDKASGSPARHYRYLSLTLSLPVPKKDEELSGE